MNFKFFFALIVSASMLLAGCSESDVDDLIDEPTIDEPTEEDVAPTAITLDETELDLFVNDIYTLTATLTPEDAVGSITWESSDNDIATVSSGGAVLANAAGVCIITVSCESLTATCVVTVSDNETGGDNGDDSGGDDDEDNIFLYAFGYGPNGEEAQSGVDGSDTAYSMTNSVVQANQWDTQFCIVFGYDNDGDGVVDQGIEEGQTYKVSMKVKTSGESIGLCPSINNEGSYLTTLSAWQETTSEWQEFAFEFEGDSSNVNGNRLTFSIGDKVSTLYVDNITIKKGEAADDSTSDSSEVELFSNGDLENDFNTLTGWTYGSTCSLGYTDEGGYNGSRGFYFTNGSVQTENWQGQIQIIYDSSTFREPDSGVTDSYVFSIKARAEEDVVVPSFQSTDSSVYTSFTGADLNVTTSWQTFEMPFTVSSGSGHIGSSQININCGQLGTTLYIDDISLIRK